MLKKRQKATCFETIKKLNGNILNESNETEHFIWETIPNMYKESNVIVPLESTMLQYKHKAGFSLHPLIRQTELNEVLDAIKQLNPNKSSEFYQNGPPYIHNLLVKVLNKCLERGYMHDTFYDGISTLFKKGDVQDSNHWRR